MTEAVIETQNAEQEDADFAKGFTDARPVEAPAEKPEAKPATEAVEAKPAVEAPKEEPKPTLIAGMTEEQWNAAVAKAVDAEGMRGEIRKNFGQFGELKRSFDDLSKKLAAGSPSAARKITKEMLKRVNEELPGLGDALAQDLSDALGSVEAAQEQAQAKAENQGKAFDPDSFFKSVVVPALQEVEARNNERAELRIVKSVHRDFDTVVRSPDFAAWLKTLPEERQKEVRESNDGFVAADAVTEFKGYAEKQKKAKEQNKTRLEKALPAASAGGPSGPVSKDDEALFADGFKQADRKYAR